MSIHYVLSREFIGKFKPPVLMVMGEEQGQVVRRVFRTWGAADRFARRIQDKPGVKNISIVRYPK